LVKEEEKKLTIKIADFGLGMVLRPSSPTQTSFKAMDSEIPIKWSAPEVIKEQLFSLASDVWSFGITVWEIFELGKTPYLELTNKECITQVANGYRLSKPKACPEKLYYLLLNCWESDPNLRPTFGNIFGRINDILAAMTLEQKNTPVNNMVFQEEDFNFYTEPSKYDYSKADLYNT